MKGSVLAVLALAAATTAVQIAKADVITFSVTPSTTNSSVTADASGVKLSTSSGDMGLLTVADTTKGVKITIPDAIFVISTGAQIGGWNNVGGGTEMGLFSAGSPGMVDVKVLSSACPAGVCLTGEQNFGSIIVNPGDGAAFSGTFTIDSIAIGTLVVDPKNPFGADSFNMYPDTLDLSTGHFTGTFTGGQITINTSSGDLTKTPEPGSLLMLGTGLLGMAGLLFWKFRMAGL